jgi:hypothetical protein
MGVGAGTSRVWRVLVARAGMSQVGSDLGMESQAAL